MVCLDMLKHGPEWRPSSGQCGKEGEDYKVEKSRLHVQVVGGERKTINQV